MPRYSYQAKLSDGQKLAGEVAAENLAAAIAELESRGLAIQSIQLASPESTQTESTQTESQQDTAALPSDATTLEHHFVKAVERKEILVPALTALASEIPAGRGRREIQQLAEAVGRAKSSTDLRRSKVAINWLPLLVNGFNSDSNTQLLSELISYASRESRNLSQRRRLFAYPLALLVLLLVVLAFLCAIALPTFDDMFRDFGLMLPTPTRTVLYISNQVRFHFPRTVLSVLVAIAVFYGIGRLWTHFAMTTRLFGSFTSGNTANVSVMSSLTSQLAELLSINLSISDALWVAGQSCQHYHFKNVAEQLARDAHSGPGMLKNSPVAHNLPANVIHALESGPDGGPNIPLLRELSAMYGDRASQRVDWSSGALAQLAIVMVGLVVGYVVLALFMPLISMVSSLS